ncbi:phosphatidylinositol-specific phospholipase C/glycerophosphodiester phosphodiesterase family protein [Flavisolibacter nicotianae]|uniref:phosphatidylinositol-specific phospholipase C/glycerophosphodiester phosphodiesterase family protein n=1 Tax=Flavisolibacter nicotianae TaxID=2364882 RepID=UPI000EB1429E|nr:phosphatidylinositol-specific phospholipase C/glycerophosphodiester phosphodiesterase family protein [Flavisolibacter nicotianae]
MRATFLFILCGFVLQAAAQSRFLKSAAQHSHNDYEQAVPFFTAYQHQFESIEADIFLANGQLVVAHDSSELKKGRLLSDLYLAPLAKVIRANQGFAYTEKDQPLQLLVDIKSEAYSTLHSLISQLQDFPDIIHCPTLRVVISGNRPREADYSRFPSFIYFDGTPNQAYTEEALNKIAMISDDFHHYSKWKGSGRLPAEEKNKLVQVIQKIHARHKPFRFWGCPDGPSAWKQFVELGVDYINTDRIERLSSFLQNASSANSLSRNDRLTLMPYNRLIRSAGKVIPFGDPALENHALDVTSLPNENLVVVEDRYSIVVLDPISGKIVDRFTFRQDARFKNFMSTYSGIKTFTTDLQTFIVWSAAEGNGSHSFLMYAQWQGKISNIGSVPFDNKSPAPNAIPNEICIANEKGITYVYVVLNGNNELVKLKWSDKSVIWKAQTGVAPYGITKANGNLYVTNWAGPLATDSTKERTGVPWGPGLYRSENWRYRKRYRFHFPRLGWKAPQRSGDRPAPECDPGRFGRTICLCLQRLQ